MLLIFLLSFWNCHPVRRTAQHFVQTENLPAILFFSTPAIYTEFFRPEEQRDSLNYYKPEKIMYYLDDTFLELFSVIYDSMLVNGLRSEGFRVFEQDSLADFFSFEGQKWQFSLQQITFEEHRLIYEDEITFTEYSVVWDTVISEFQFNVWFELLPVNKDTSVPAHVFFASLSISDDLEGKFVYDWGRGVYDYVYELTEVLSSDIMSLVAVAAIKHSEYLFDFFLNRHLYFSLPESKKSRIYYTWNRVKQKPVPAGYERFIFL